MPQVRAKFTCVAFRVTKGTVWDSEGKNPVQGLLYEYEFHAVTKGDAEDTKFWASTPSGTLKISSVRENQFELNETYYLDFTKVEAQPA